MSTEAKKIISDYLNFSGVRSSKEIQALLNRANACTPAHGSVEYHQIVHIRQKLYEAFKIALEQRGRVLELSIKKDGLMKYGDDPQLGKFKDTGDVPDGGRMDQFWDMDKNKPEVQFNPENTQVRKGPKLPENFDLENERYLLKYFGLRAIEYGRWLTQQDCVNYLAGCGLAMYDLHKILGFHPEQIGMYGIITPAFGARGRGKTVAHFEPDTFAINMTRFERPENGTYAKPSYNRSKLIFTSGGIGAFCHEFGHALDFFGGTFAEPSQQKKGGSESGALSFGISTRTTPDEDLMKKKTLRGKMERLLFKIIWKRDGSDRSDYYKRVKRAAKEEPNPDYWIYRAEIFARCFEVYVFYKLEAKGWFNTFLNDKKYSEAFYPTKAELRPVERDFDELISALRSAIRPGMINRIPKPQKAKPKKKKGK